MGLLSLVVPFFKLKALFSPSHECVREAFVLVPVLKAQFEDSLDEGFVTGTDGKRDVILSMRDFFLLLLKCDSMLGLAALNREYSLLQYGVIYLKKQTIALKTYFFA